MEFKKTTGSLLQEGTLVQLGSNCNRVVPLGIDEEELDSTYIAKVYLMGTGD